MLQLLYRSCGLLLLLTGPALASAINTSSGWNMPPGVTDISREIYSLHMIIFWICVAIAVVVFGVMFWSLFVYRKSKGAKPAHFHENTTVEVIWTAIPLAILVIMAIPATATLKKIYDASDAEIDILVTGYQWRWHYQYLDQDISFFSNLGTPRSQILGEEDKGDFYLLEVDNPLVLPVGKKVRFLFTSNDVIHAWWVPDLAIKKDTIPGFINESWTIINEPGTYRGQCAELCGQDHAYMPIEVRAVTEEVWLSWLDEQRETAAAEAASGEREWTLAELNERGAGVYTTYCAACHQADGSGMPPAFPALRGNPVMTSAEGRDKHINAVLFGRPGTSMPGYGTTLSVNDLAAVITYERNAWGNDTGDAVQPSEIRALLDR
ncbi:cytochrome c oxidase subunit II [Marinospirillum alkaliphilum]|uniref:Cytochrome c oxidase subunit 2 n=1 Tax=Marinospirillum alkaliphilum DSM 21637 TaxID=1122209 RepID=A0A1K1VZC4_9GAMM|nr:cytochrome c oxidase subunit 2 [Marinospirillum alkaliphilum DSM 21637]